MSEVTLRQLEYLVAVTETGSVTAAAERCRVTQAAVSTALGQLETTVGAPLMIRRRGKRIAMTSEGLAVAAHARTVLDEVGRMPSIVSEVRGRLSGHLVIAVFRTLAVHVIPALIEWFRERHPEVQLEFIEGSGTGVQEELLTGRAHLAVIYGAQLEPSCHSVELRASRRMAVMSPDHPLADHPRLTLRELAEHPAIILDEEPSLQRTLATFAAEGLTPLVPWRSRSVEAILNVAGRGSAYTLLMQPRTRSPEGRPLIFRHIPHESLNNPVLGALPRGIAPSALVTEALRAIREGWGTAEPLSADAL